MSRIAISRSPRRRRGFSLIEGLIALLVVAIGALAIARFSGLSARQAEAARHRTEAVLLAQGKLDELRSEVLLEGSSPRFGPPASGTDEPPAASNTRFTRRWQVTGAPTDAQRQIDVQVGWTDRDGQAGDAGVVLQAIVARADPAGTARLALPTRASAAAREPFGRSAAIPWSAVRLGGANRGRSVLRDGAPDGTYLVFDDVGGQVIAECDAPPDDRTDTATACAPIEALLLGGFLAGDDADAALGIAFEQLEHAVAAPVCRIDPAVAPDGQTIPGVRAYRCLVRPGDHDGNAGTARVWSGRVIVLPQPTGTQSVCRYVGVAVPGDAPRNEDHPDRYTHVSRTLQHQNFARIASGPCPEGSVLHQPR